MDTKLLVMFLLKAVKENGYSKGSTLSVIREIIKNKNNSDSYVFDFIYDKIPEVCAFDVDAIIELLKENKRL